MKTSRIGLVIGIAALASCGKGKTVGPEVCGVVAAKAKLCHKELWAHIGEDPYGASYRKDYEGKEQAWCEQQFSIREAQGDVFDSCIKIDDCKAWSECVYPNGFFHGNK